MNLKSSIIILVVFVSIGAKVIAVNSYDPVNFFVMDNAEDGAPSKGYNGNYVTNVYDNIRKSRVTFLKGSSSLYRQFAWDPSFHGIKWNIPAKGISWGIRSNNPFDFRVTVETDNGTRNLHYYCDTDEKTDTDDNFYIKLDDSYRDGNWHDIIKDLDNDIANFESDNAVQSVTLVFIKTSSTLAVDDIRVYPADTNDGNDITAPEIYLNGDNNIEIIQGNTYNELGATCFDNVTPVSVLDANLHIDASDIDIDTPGLYRVKYNLDDEAGNSSQTVYRVVNVRTPEIVVGARKVYATPADMGTFFVSPEGSGNGDGTSLENAVGWSSFLTSKWEDVKPGDVVFFKGGTYYFTEDLPGLTFSEGRKSYPIIYESYPGDTAVFDGSRVDTLDIHSHNGNVTLFGNYIWLRNVEFKRLPHWGPRVWGAHCIIEGVTSHHNLLSGLEVSKGFNSFQNILRDNYLYENSDLGIKGRGDVYDEYNYGNNADGITLHSGTANIVTHNVVDGNSDDGIDSWAGQLTVFSYNFVSRSGKRDYKGYGDGGGIKLGSANAYGTQVSHNIIYKCNMEIGTYVTAIKNNATTGAVMSYNTLHKSKYSIDYVASSRIYRNILLRATHGLLNGPHNPTPAASLENSFNMIPAFLPPDYEATMDEYCTNAESRMISIDDTSNDFLHPKPNDLFANIGAYANDDSLPDIIPPTVFPYGISTVGETERVEKGSLYIEHGAFAYDAKDGFLPVTIDETVETNKDETYFVTYTATDAAGNSSSYKKVVIVGEGAPDYINDLDENTEFNVYPNPAKDFVNIKLKNTKSNNIIIRVINLNGIVLSTHSIYGSANLFEKSLNVSKLANGIYIIRIEDGKNTYHSRIIVSK